MIGSYCYTLWKIIRTPKSFFENLPLTGGIGAPLFFALLTNWIGLSIFFLWNLLGEALLPNFNKKIFFYRALLKECSFFLNENQMEWFFQVSAVLLNPFFTLFQILFSAIIFFISARIFIPDNASHFNKLTFESVVRVVCYAMAPAFFYALPLLGSFLAQSWIFLATLIGFKVVFQISTIRAFLILLFPMLLLLLLALTAITMLALCFYATMFT